MATDHDDLATSPAGATAVGSARPATVPSPSHGASAAGHDDHDDHDDHGPAEDARWVLIPLLVGLVIGIILIAVFGLQSGAHPTG